MADKFDIRIEFAIEVHKIFIGRVEDLVFGICIEQVGHNTIDIREGFVVNLIGVIISA